MSEENKTLVELGNLGSAKPDDVDKALQGQPDTVDENPPEKRDDRTYMDFGTLSGYGVENDSGATTLYNPFDNNLRIDLDQFETRRRRVNENSLLSGLVNGVEGLEEGFLYNGIEQVADRSQEAQGYLNKMKNGVTQFVGETAINVGQGFATLLYGMPSAVVNGDITKLYDNSVANTLDAASEDFQKFYEIKRGGNQSTGKRLTNFLFDDFLGGASFVAGAIATEMAFSALTVATLGAAAPAQAAATAGLVARGARLAKKALHGGKRLMGAGLVDDALRQSAQLTGTATRQTASQALRQAGQAIKGPQALQASARVSRQLLTGAGMESGMEARHMLNAAVDKQKEQYESVNGQDTFTEEMAENFREEISGHADAVFGVNMALVGASNMLMFPKLFGVGLNRGMRTTKFVDTSKMTAKARKATAKQLGIAEANLPRYVDAARGTRMGRNMRRTVALRDMAYEGLVEEGGQGAISRTAEDYIAKKYDPQNVRRTADFTESFLDGLKGSYTTKDGLKEIGIGMMLSLTGAPMIARGTDSGNLGVRMMGGYYGQGGLKARRAEQDATLNNLVNLVENDGNVGKILKAEIANMHTQNGLQVDMDEAVKAMSMKRGKDIESEQIFSHASSKILTGRYEDAIAEYEQILEEMSDEDYRNELGDAGKNLTDSEVQEMKSKQLETYKRRMSEVRKAYEQAGEVYRGEDPDVHTGAAWMLYNVKDRDAREASIAQMLAEEFGQDLNGDQVLDLVKAQEVLELDDEFIEAYRQEQKAIAALEKQLATKRERGQIKNVDPEKAKDRERALSENEKLLAERIAARDRMFAQMQKKADKANYEFDNAIFDDILATHEALQRTGQITEPFDQTRKEQLEQDLAEVRADRVRLIQAYNDFVSPGGVDRFEASLRGSIEAMVERNERDPQESENIASQESADVTEKADASNETSSVADPSQAVPPEDGAPPEAADPEEAAPEVADPFSDMAPAPVADPADTAPPDVADPVGVADPTTVAPPEEGAEVSTDQAVPTTSNGTWSIKLLPDSPTTPGAVNEELEQGNTELFVGGVQVGEEIEIRQEGDNVLYLLRGKVIKSEPVQYTPADVKTQLVQSGNSVKARVQVASSMQSGGTRIRPQQTTVDRGQTESVSKHVDKSQVLAVYVRTSGDIRQVAGQEISDHPTRTTNSTGQSYIYTKDARTGQVSWHQAIGGKLNENTARGLIALERSFHRLAEGTAKPEDLQSIQNMSEVVEGISLEPTAAYANFRRVLRHFVYDGSSYGKHQQLVREQGNVDNSVGYFGNAGGFEVYTVDPADNKVKKLSSSNEADLIRLIPALANARRNVVISHNEKDTVVPGLDIVDGVVTPKTAVPVLDYYHSHMEFTERMPVVIDGKTYNEIYTGLTLQLGPVEVPTNVETPTISAEARARYADALSEDDIDDLPAVAIPDAVAEGPMARAGRLFLVEGLNAAEVRLITNEFVGRMAEELVTHRKTVARDSGLNANYFKNKLRAEVEQALQFMRTQPQSARRDYLIETYEKILDPVRFDKISDLSFLELLRNAKGMVGLRGGTVNEAIKNLLSDERAELESTNRDAAEVREAENPMAAFDDTFAFGVNPTSRLRLEAKMALMTIRHTGRPTVITRGLFGKTFVDHNTLVEKLNRSLVGTGYSWSEMQERLQEKSNEHPEFLDVIAKFTTLPDGPNVDRAAQVLDQMQNQFVTAMSLEPSTREVVTVRRGAKKKVQVWNSNDRNMKQFAQQDMVSHFIAFGIFNPDKTINDANINAFNAKLRKLADLGDEAAKQKAVSAALASIGIVVPAEAFNEKNIPGITQDLRNAGSEVSLFGKFRAAMRDAQAGQKDLDSSILVDARAVNFFTEMAKYRDNFIQNSSKDGNGNTIFHFSAPKLMNQRFRDMMSGEMTNNPLARDMRAHKIAVDLSYFGGIKINSTTSQRDFHGVELSDKSFARLGLFGNQNTFSSTGRLMSKHMVPTIGDKSTAPIVTVPSLNIPMALNPEVLNKKVEDYDISDFLPAGGLQQIYKERMRWSVQTEMDRLRIVKRGKRESLEEDSEWNTLTNAQRQSRGFVLMPALNGLAQKYLDTDMTWAEFQKLGHEQAVEVMRSQLNSDLQHMMQNTKNIAWTATEDGLLDKVTYFDGGKLEFKYVRSHVNPDATWSDVATRKLGMPAFAAKFVIESMYVNTGLIIGMLGDPGAFTKGNQHATAVNLGKRLASLIAPGTVIPTVQWEFRGKTKSNSKVRTLVMPARTVSKAAHYNYLQELGQSAEQLAAQTRYDSADAAEYTTTEEHLSILYAQGKIRRDELNALLAKSQSNEEFTQDELTKYFQPMKPVTSAVVDGHSLYIKSASFPLVEQLTRGTELDKLREFMETPDENGNTIQRAAFTSAVKVGDVFEDKQDVFEDDKVVVSDELRNQVLEYDRKFMRIQQEVPASVGTEKVRSSQATKLVFAGLADVDTKFTLDGQSKTGKEMYNIYTQAVRDEIQAQRDIFIERYGFEVDGAELKHTAESKKKFAERILEEAVSRGYGVNELADLYFNEETGQFDTPLSQGISSERIESLIQSIYRKELMGLNIEGFSGPIRPEIGMSLDTLDAEAKSSIVWVERNGKRVWNGKKLQVAQYDKPDQIILPWKYAGKLKDFAKDGVIKAEDLPAELLNVFANRIPSQLKSSSASFEIVGFLPGEYADTLIVPEELVGRMGQDYDIDKMFGMMYKAELVNGKLQVVREGSTPQARRDIARNRQLDIFIASMRSKDINVQKAIHSPVTDGYAESLAQELDTTESRLGMPMSVSYNDSKAEAARSAKRAIGVFALNNVMQAQLESALERGDIMITRPIIIHESATELMSDEDMLARQYLGTRNIEDKTFLLPYSYKNEKGEMVAYTPEAGTRQEQFSRLLNHSLDNENNQLLSKLDINEQTWFVYNGMTHSGYNQETIALFLRQPIVQEYMQRNFQRRALLSEEFGLDTMMAERDAKLKQLGYADMKSFRTALSEGRHTPLNKADMLSVYQGGELADVADQLAMDVQLIDTLSRLRNLENGLRELQVVMSMDTSRPKTRADLEYQMQRARNFMQQDKKLTGGNLDTPLMFSEMAKSAVMDNTISGIMFNQALRSHTVLDMPGESVYVTPLVQTLISDAETLGWDGTAIDTYLKGVKSYLNAKWVQKLTGKSAQTVRNEFADPNTGLPSRLIKLRHEKAEVRDNIFVRQLLAFDNPQDEKGIRLEFTADRVLNVSETETVQGFLSLLRSTDPEVLEFAQDLVVYHLASAGGKLKSRGFGKVIPSEYLQELGIRDALAFNSAEYGYYTVNSSMHDQIIRHNPKLAPYSEGKITSKANGMGLFDTTSVSEEELARINGVGFFRSGNVLYRLTGRNTDKFSQVEAVSRLGNYLSNQYVFGQEAPNETVAEVDADVVNEDGDVNAALPEKGPSEVIGAPQTEAMDYAEQQSTSGLEAPPEVAAPAENLPMGIEDLVIAMGLDRTNPVLEFMIEKEKQADPGMRLKISVVSNDTAPRGSYNAATHTVQLNKKKGGLTKRAIIHELVHAYSSRGINLVNKFPGQNRNTGLGRAVREVEDLRLSITRSPEVMERMGLEWPVWQQFLRGYNIYQQNKNRPGGIDRSKLSPSQVADLNTFLDQGNLDLYYGLVNAKEFVAESLSNPAFVERLTRVEQSTQGTLFDQIMDAIAEILVGLGVAADNVMGRRAVQSALQVLKEQAARQDIQLEIEKASRTIEENDAQMEMDELPASADDVNGLSQESLEALRDYKEKRIQQFQEMQSRFKDKRGMRKVIRQRIVQEQRELKMLNDDSVSPEVILDIGRRELEDAKDVLKRSVTQGEGLEKSLSAMQNVFGAIEFYEGIRGVVKDEVAKEQLNELRAEAAVLRDNYLEKAKQILVGDLKKTFSGTKAADMVTMDTFDKIDEVSGAMSRFMDASRQGRLELSYLDRIVRDAVNLQKADFNARSAQYLEKTKAFQQSAYFKKHKWNGMVQLDAAGNPTPRLIGALSGKFEAEVQQKRVEFGDNLDGFYKWMRSRTTTIPIAATYDYSGDTAVRKENPAVMRKLEAELGVLGAEEALNRQDALIQDFIDAREAEFDIIDMTESDPEQRKALKAQWLKENDPAKTFQFKVSVPKRTINGKSTGYYDARFEEMQKDKAAVEYYKFYTSQMKEMLAMLPAHKLQQFDNSLLENGLFIPAIQKSLTSDLLNGGWRKGVGVLTDAMKASLTITGEDSLSKLIDPVTGKPREELPVYFTTPLKAEDQEYNMDKTFLAFTMMATTYHSKNMIEDKVRMTRSVLHNSSVTSRDRLGNKLLNKIGIELPGKKGQADREGLVRVVDTVVNDFYGFKTTRDAQATAPEFMWTAEQKAQVQKLREKVDSEPDPEKKAVLQQELDNATPRASAAKSIYRVQQFTQAKGMAWNVPAATVNMIFGSLAVFKHAAGRTDFTEADARAATGLMLNSSLNGMTLNYAPNKTALKIQNLMVNLDVLKDFTEMRFDPSKFVKQASEAGVSAARQQGISKLRMYEIQRSSEYFVYGQVMLAVLKGTKVNGKPLLDYVDDNGVIQLDGYRPGETKHSELINKIDQINKRVHGNYDPNSPIAFKKTMIGPLLMQFRSWLPEAIASRVESERYDAHLDRTVKGTFRTMIDLGWVKGMKALLPMMVPSYMRPKSFDKLDGSMSEIDQENVRKFAAGLRHWMQVSMLIMFLRSLDDEDDDESRWLLNYGLNISTRLENDLSLFGDPRSIKDMTQGDFMAIMGLMDDIGNFSDATWKTMLGDATIPTGRYAGKSRMLHHGGKLMPHTGALQRLLNNLASEINIQ